MKFFVGITDLMDLEISQITYYIGRLIQLV